MYRAGIIGCGGIAGLLDPPDALNEKWTFTHAGAYSLCKRTELVAIADPDAARRDELGAKFGVDATHRHADYRSMLEREKLDIVSLCLPTELHLEAFRAACDAGVRAIFLEKPLAYRLDEAAEIVKLSEKRAVTVNYFRRWIPEIAEAAREIRSGAHGAPLAATVRYVKGLYGNASHLIDLARWFFGEPATAEAILVRDPVGDAQIDFRLSFSQGAQGGIPFEVYFLAVPKAKFVFIEFEIICEKARLVISQRGMNYRREPLVRDPFFGRFDVMETMIARESGWKNSPLRAIDELISKLEGRGEVAVSPSEAFKTLEVCATIRENSGLKPMK